MRRLLLGEWGPAPLALPISPGARRFYSGEIFGFFLKKKKKDSPQKKRKISPE
jgi:hypothetical protein